MNVSNHSVKILLFSVLLLSFCHNANAQRNSSISIQFAPLNSNLLYAEKVIDNQLSIVKSSKLGLASALKFEIDLNKYFSASTGFAFEIRRNNVNAVSKWDTINYPEINFMNKFYSTETYRFIGLPISLYVNYLNNQKLRIYQTFGTQLSVLLSTYFSGKAFYRSNEFSIFNINRPNDNKSILVSFTSSIGFRERVGNKLAIKVEPGIMYMINSCSKRYNTKEKFFDYKVDLGLIYFL